MAVHWNQQKLAYAKKRLAELEEEIALCRSRREYVRENELKYEHRNILDQMKGKKNDIQKAKTGGNKSRSRAEVSN